MSEASHAPRVRDRPGRAPGLHALCAAARGSRARSRTVILAPERAYELDPIGLIVLRAIDGATRLADLCARLARAIRGAARRHHARRDHASARARRQAAVARRTDRLCAAASLPPSPLRSRPSRAGRRGCSPSSRIAVRCNAPIAPIRSNSSESNAELTADEWGETLSSGGVDRRAAAASFRRRTDRATRSRRDSRSCRRGGALHQSRHLRRAADARTDCSDSPRSASIMCRSRFRTSCRRAPTASPPCRAASPRSATSRAGRASSAWALTINAPMHRQNIAHLPQIIDFAVEVDAQRIEIAHIQYYAWAQVNRAALDPDARGLHGDGRQSSRTAKKRLQGVLNFDFVIHDHYATRPKHARAAGAARSWR